MKRVIFLIYHGMGHFNACFRLATILQRDHEVIFAGVEFFKRYVEAQHFQYYPLKTVPFGLGFETWVNTVAGHKFEYLHTLRDRWTNRLFILRREELDRMVTDLAPYAILIDSLQSTDLVALYDVLKERGIKTAFLQTMPSTALQPGKPPVNSFVLPGDYKAIKKAARRSMLNLHKKAWLKKLKYFGMDDRAIIRRAIGQSKFPREYISPLPAPMGLVFNPVPEFILTPHEFDFPGFDPLPFQHYVGFMSNSQRVESSDKLYYEVRTQIKEKLHAGARMIYCAFSTVPHKNNKTIRSFIEKLLRAAGDKNTVLLISIPAGYPEIKPAGNTPANAYFLNGAPQLEILGYSDLFITHGGINSIKEAIYAGVPVLVYPTNSYFDAPGITTRVVFHQLGLRGDLKRDSTQDIGRKITELLTNDVYRKKIHEMQDADAGYTEEKFRFLFEGLKGPA